MLDLRVTVGLPPPKPKPNGGTYNGLRRRMAVVVDLVSSANEERWAANA